MKNIDEGFEQVWAKVEKALGGKYPDSLIKNFNTIGKPLYFLGAQFVMRTYLQGKDSPFPKVEFEKWLAENYIKTLETAFKHLNDN
jgi:hypothetical protein